MDPVCQMDRGAGPSAAAQSKYQGQTYYFCAVGCKQKFDAGAREVPAGGE